ncbi:MAG: hypothetical protein KJ592_04385 [Nanoarchaeota archaeon]|nr:hypothetical protein [Nanoarchaeota archaeon]
MKKGVMILLLLLSVNLTSALACNLDVTLLNQDPYPAVPDDYVKLVFQVDGIDSTDCNDITFNLLADYPIEFDPGKSGLRTFKKVDYIKDFESTLLIPYKVRVDAEALDGTNPIEVSIQSRGDAPQIKSFDIEVEDVRADFEVHVKDYSYETNEITIEILNIESSDIEALTVEIPKQERIDVKGSNRILVGDLDSNEYTTADFEATIDDGEFKINLIYSDAINERRTLEKTISFDSSYFKGRKADQSTTSTGTYIFYLAIVAIGIYFIYRKINKKKKAHHHKQ